MDRASPDPERPRHLQDAHALRKLPSHLPLGRAVDLRSAEPVTSPLGLTVLITWSLDVEKQRFTPMKSRSKKRTPNIVNLTVKRRYLTQREIDRLMDCARKHGRYGHRDATMILVAYRHGLRASEVCDLQWQQIELSEGRLHVHRVKN